MDSLVLDPRLVRAEHIRARLRLAGWSTKQLSKAHGLQPYAVDVALTRAHEAGEQVIARVLGERPEALWPDRYDVRTGERLSPQPRQNYEPLPTLAQRRTAHSVGGRRI